MLFLVNSTATKTTLPRKPSRSLEFRALKLIVCVGGRPTTMLSSLTLPGPILSSLVNCRLPVQYHCEHQKDVIPVEKLNGLRRRVLKCCFIDKNVSRACIFVLRRDIRTSAFASRRILSISAELPLLASSIRFSFRVRARTSSKFSIGPRKGSAS